MHEKQIDFPRTAGGAIGGWWSLVTLMVCVDRNVGSTMLKPYVHGPRLPAAYVNVNAISAPIVVLIGHRHSRFVCRLRARTMQTGVHSLRMSYSSADALAVWWSSTVWFGLICLFGVRVG